VDRGDFPPAGQLGVILKSWPRFGTLGKKKNERAVEIQSAPRVGTCGVNIRRRMVFKIVQRGKDISRYSPAFKFQVVLEALKAEGKGDEAQVVQAYRASGGLPDSRVGRLDTHHSPESGHSRLGSWSPIEPLKNKRFVCPKSWPKTAAKMVPFQGCGSNFKDIKLNG